MHSFLAMLYLNQKQKLPQVCRYKPLWQHAHAVDNIFFFFFFFFFFSKLNFSLEKNLTCFFFVCCGYTLEPPRCFGSKISLKNVYTPVYLHFTIQKWDLIKSVFNTWTCFHNALFLFNQVILKTSENAQSNKQ